MPNFLILLVNVGDTLLKSLGLVLNLTFASTVSEALEVSVALLNTLVVPSTTTEAETASEDSVSLVLAASVVCVIWLRRALTAFAVLAVSYTHLTLPTICSV